MAKAQFDSNAVEQVISYLEYDEKRHYEESGKPKNHIWIYIKRLKSDLKSSKK